MTDVKLRATVVGFNDKHEAIATLKDGTEIFIDPFVTCLWPWEHRMNLLGTWTFKGFWSSSEPKAFLPDEVQREDRDDDAR